MLPSHSQTSKFLQRGLFNGISHFTQLEARIAEFASEEERLAVFSVFVEAFLAVRTLPQATEIWPEGIIPVEAQRRYTLPEGIPGADGIFRALSGEIHPYQLLFRSPVIPPQEGAVDGSPRVQKEDCAILVDRPALSRKDIAPFLVLADRVSQPLLFTNATTLPTPLQNRDGFHCIRGSDLDRLTPRAFNAMRRWLQGGGIVPERAPLLSHHAQAMADLKPFLEASDRVMGLAAPGTGVELLALKLAEGVGSGQTVLVLLPSLARIRDILFLWRHHAVWAELSCLWVGTDASVGHDAPLVRQADLDVPLVSDIEAVRRFLAWRFHGVRVLFTTYSSARIVARAMIGFSPLDLGLFLESQETVSDPFSLDDTNLPIHKRLFFGVSIRHAQTIKKQIGRQEREPRLIWSLEDTSRYGTVLPVAPLAEATANGMLRPWKFLIVVVPSETVSPETVSPETVSPETVSPETVPSESISEKTEEETREDACGYALSLALTHPACHDVRHIYTYHGNPQEARSFAGMAGHPALTKYTLLHLKGASSAADRDQILYRFGQAERAILSNARCLAEGLTSPLAEMVVFFASPRKAKLNIAHALTAILTNPVANLVRAGEQQGADGQNNGLICVPLFLSKSTQGEPDTTLVEKSLEASDALWEVLQVLRELDGALDNHISQAGETYGRTGCWPSRADGAGGSEWEKAFEIILPDHLPSAWEEQILNGCLERLSSVWDQRFGQLQRYDWNEVPGLEKWVEQQRDAFKKGTLSQERIQRLETFGFVWDPEAVAWEALFSDFLQFKKKEEHGKIPESWPDNPPLAAWAKVQRKERIKEKLSVERFTRLENAGFCWDLEVAYWDDMMALLTHFHQEHGHSMVPFSWPENPHLADWVSKQRRDFSSGRLGEALVARLNALDFIWDLEKKEWNDMFAALSEFFEAEGHCHVPDHSAVLADWVRRQRRAGMSPTVSKSPRARRNALNASQRQRLDSLGFIWDTKEAEWDLMFLELQNFCKERNHCIVPAKMPENGPYKTGGPRLARWVKTLRQAYANKTLAEEKVQKLNNLGFVWDAKAVFWEEMFAALVEFRDRYGNCLVPETYEENNQLAWWVAAQRKACQTGQLESERVSRLSDLGFFWDPLEAHWYEMFQVLVRYREQFGHCLIARDWTGHPKLASWVVTQRQARLNGHLSQLRIDRLDTLGFFWDQKEVVLEEMLTDLAAFKQQHGHCNVPVPWPKNPALGLWVQFQRQEYKKGKLAPNRIQRLETLDFSWDGNVRSQITSEQKGR